MLLEFLGFKNGEGVVGDYPRGKYRDVADKYATAELEHEHEEKLEDDHGPVFFLTHFPNYTSPFWNMQQNKEAKHAEKVDVIIHGVETIGAYYFVISVFIKSFVGFFPNHCKLIFITVRC